MRIGAQSVKVCDIFSGGGNVPDNHDAMLQEFEHFILNIQYQ